MNLLSVHIVIHNLLVARTQSDKVIEKGMATFNYQVQPTVYMHAQALLRSALILLVLY